MNSLKLTITLLLIGFIFATQGSDIVFTGSGNTCSDKCPKLSDGISWITGKDNSKCAVSNCLNIFPSQSTAMLSDFYCQSRPGTPNGSVSAIYVHVSNHFCVASSTSRDNSKRPANSWTKEDCLACQGLRYSTSSDKSSYQANSISVLVISVLMIISLIY
ncbi:hypothetical protein ABPG72_000513 [Tetrahymena utriculariae]